MPDSPLCPMSALRWWARSQGYLSPTNIMCTEISLWTFCLSQNIPKNLRPSSMCWCSMRVSPYWVSTDLSPLGVKKADRFRNEIFMPNEDLLQKAKRCFIAELESQSNSLYIRHRHSARLFHPQQRHGSQSRRPPPGQEDSATRRQAKMAATPPTAP